MARGPRRTPPSDADVRERIVAATRELLLSERRFDELNVADILSAAGVARGSFYFYFEGKHDVLAELVRRAIADTRSMASSWLTAEGTDTPAGIRASHEAGALFWERESSLLRAIVENWQTEPQLDSLWRELMDSFIEQTEARIRANQKAGTTPRSVDAHDLAATLTWLGERLYYLAATDVEPFSRRESLIDMLTYVWTAALHPGQVPMTGKGTPSSKRAIRSK